MPNTIVIFGASGDLTSRKLIPALYSLFAKGRLPKGTRIVGVARTKFSNEAWRDELTATTQKFAGKEFDAVKWQEFAANVFYHPGDIDKLADFQALAKTLNGLEGNQPMSRLYYLATAPSLYAMAIAHLGGAGLADESHGTRRVVIEKPFGTDLKSARELNRATHEVFRAHGRYYVPSRTTVSSLRGYKRRRSAMDLTWCCKCTTSQVAEATWRIRSSPCWARNPTARTRSSMPHRRIPRPTPQRIAHCLRAA